MRTPHPRSIVTSVLLVAGLLAGGATPASAAQKDRCNLKGHRTIALNKLVRVYEKTTLTLDYYACVRKTGKKIKLWESDGVYTFGSVAKMAGYHVAFTFDEIPACKADCPPGVEPTNLLAVADPRTGTIRQLHDGTFWSVRLKASGSVAWLYAPETGGTALDAWTTSRATLDSGDISNVRVRGAELVWEKAGAEFTAPFA